MPLPSTHAAIQHLLHVCFLTCFTAHTCKAISNSFHEPPELINTAVGEHSLGLWPADAGLPPPGSQSCQPRPEPLPSECREHPARSQNSWRTHLRHVPHWVPSQVFVGEQGGSSRLWRTPCQVPAGGGDPLWAVWANSNSILSVVWLWTCSVLMWRTPAAFCVMSRMSEVHSEYIHSLPSSRQLCWLSAGVTSITWHNMEIGMERIVDKDRLCRHA